MKKFIFLLLSSLFLATAIVNAGPTEKRTHHKKSHLTAPGHIKRPLNSFMIYAQEFRSLVRAEFPDLHNHETSKILGERWKALSPEEKAVYQKKAAEAKSRHEQLYPDYKYNPLNKRNAGSAGENGRAQKGSSSKKREQAERLVAAASCSSYSSVRVVPVSVTGGHMHEVLQFGVEEFLDAGDEEGSLEVEAGLGGDWAREAGARDAAAMPGLYVPGAAAGAMLNPVLGGMHELAVDDEAFLDELLAGGDPLERELFGGNFFM